MGSGDEKLAASDGQKKPLRDRGFIITCTIEKLFLEFYFLIDRLATKPPQFPAINVGIACLIKGSLQFFCQVLEILVA